MNNPVLCRFGLLDTEDGGTTLPRNVGKVLPVDEAQYSTKYYLSAALCGSKLLRLKTYFKKLQMPVIIVIVKVTGCCSVTLSGG